jgi:hypothetical protein
VVGEQFVVDVPGVSQKWLGVGVCMMMIDDG